MNILAIYWDVDPVLFSIGSLSVRYYGLCFIVGFTLGYALFKYFFQREKVPVTLLDGLLYTLVFGTMVGARLGHCLFYDPGYYLANPIKILYIWEGGLASHGGALFLLLCMWIYAKYVGKKHHFSFLWILDRLAIATALVACFIRLGNLMNSEIYGVQTSLPWGFIFLQRGETLPKHPTQIYEALSYLAIFFLLLYLYRKKLPKLREGFLIGLFFLLVFSARFVIEYIKNPQVDFEKNMVLDMGQILSVPFIILGAALLLYSVMRGKPAMRQVPEKPAKTAAKSVVKPLR